MASANANPLSNNTFRHGLMRPVSIWLAILAAGLFVFAWRGYAQAASQAHDQGWKQAAVPAVGDVAPGFSLPDITGRSVSLASFRGRSIVLAFFCGCDRCHAAALKIASRQRAGDFGNFVAVVAMDQQEAIAFQSATKVRGTILVDPDENIAVKYGSEFCPRLWGIRSDGRIAFRSKRALEDGDLADALDKANAFLSAGRPASR
jgi:peroxiredoxin